MTTTQTTNCPAWCDFNTHTDGEHWHEVDQIAATAADIIAQDDGLLVGSVIVSLEQDDPGGPHVAVSVADPGRRTSREVHLRPSEARRVAAALTAAANLLEGE